MSDTKRACLHEHDDGRSCGAPPLKGGDHCFWHAPDKSDEAAKARRLGGIRRKREKTVAGAYDLSGLNSIPAIQRLVDIATLDTLALDNSVARNRLLAGLAATAKQLLEAEREAEMAWEVE